MSSAAAPPSPALVGTVGELAVPDGAINIIPGRCELSLDIRAGDDAIREAACRRRARRDRADRAAPRRDDRRPSRWCAGDNVPCTPRIQRCWRTRLRGAGVADALSAERRRPRCHAVCRRDRYRHAVRALRQRRGEPYAARDHHRARTPTSPRASCSTRFCDSPQRHDARRAGRFIHRARLRARDRVPRRAGEGPERQSARRLRRPCGARAGSCSRGWASRSRRMRCRRRWSRRPECEA